MKLVAHIDSQPTPPSNEMFDQLMQIANELDISLQESVTGNRIHNSTNDLFGPITHAQRVLIAMTRLSQHNFQLAHHIEQVLTKEGAEAANSLMDRSTGFSISRDVELFMPFLFMDLHPSGIRSICSKIVEAYSLAKDQGKLDDFLIYCLGRGGTCYQGVAETIADYQVPKSLAQEFHIMPQGDYEAQSGEFPSYGLYLLSQYEMWQAKRYQQLVACDPPTKDLTSVLLDPAFSQSAFGSQDHIGYWRGLAHFMSEIGVEDVQNCLTDAGCPDHWINTALETGMQRLRRTFEQGGLAHRVECYARRQNPGAHRTHFGLSDTLRKMRHNRTSPKDPLYSPVVKLEPEIPFMTYIRKFNSPAVFIVLDSFAWAYKHDIGSDRLGEITKHYEYISRSATEKVDYYAAAIGKPYKLYATRFEWDLKMREIKLRRQCKENDYSSKYALPKAFPDRKQLEELLASPDAVDHFLSGDAYTDPNSLDAIQVVQAMAKLKKMPPEDQRTYLDKAYTSPPDYHHYFGKKILRHNEYLSILTEPDQMVGVQVVPRLPGTYAQSLGMQKTVLIESGGDPVPLVLFDPVSQVMEEVTADALMSLQSIMCDPSLSLRSKKGAVLDWAVAHHITGLNDYLIRETISYQVEVIMTSGCWDAAFELIDTYAADSMVLEIMSLSLSRLSGRLKSRDYLRSQNKNVLDLILRLLHMKGEHISGLLYTLARLIPDVICSTYEEASLIGEALIPYLLADDSAVHFQVLDCLLILTQEFRYSPSPPDFFNETLLDFMYDRRNLPKYRSYIYFIWSSWPEARLDIIPDKMKHHLRDVLCSEHESIPIRDAAFRTLYHFTFKDRDFLRTMIELIPIISHVILLDPYTCRDSINNLAHFLQNLEDTTIYLDYPEIDEMVVTMLDQNWVSRDNKFNLISYFLFMDYQPKLMERVVKNKRLLAVLAKIIEDDQEPADVRQGAIEILAMIASCPTLIPILASHTKLVSCAISSLSTSDLSLEHPAVLLVRYLTLNRAPRPSKEIMEAVEVTLNELVSRDPESEATMVALIKILMSCESGCLVVRPWLWTLLGTIVQHNPTNDCIIAHLLDLVFHFTQCNVQIPIDFMTRVFALEKNPTAVLEILDGMVETAPSLKRKDKKWLLKERKHMTPTTNDRTFRSFVKLVCKTIHASPHSQAAAVAAGG